MHASTSVDWKILVNLSCAESGYLETNHAPRGKRCRVQWVGWTRSDSGHRQNPSKNSDDFKQVGRLVIALIDGKLHKFEQTLFWSHVKLRPTPVMLRSLTVEGESKRDGCSTLDANKLQLRWQALNATQDLNVSCSETIIKLLLLSKLKLWASSRRGDYKKQSWTDNPTDLENSWFSLEG